jgi:hypothetical protein
MNASAMPDAVAEGERRTRWIHLEAGEKAAAVTALRAIARDAAEGTHTLDRATLVAVRAALEAAADYLEQVSSPTTSGPNATRRERVYDAEISPLVARIAQVCAAHGIPAVLSFQLDDVLPARNALLCATSMLPDGSSESLRIAAEVIVKGAASLVMRVMPGARRG